MKLRYSPASPFVRKVMVLAHEAGLAERLEPVPTDVWSADSDIADDNPLGKVPALAGPDGTLVNSAIICEYLDSLHDRRRFFPPEGPARWRAQRLHGLGDGIMDAAVGRVVEELRRPEAYVYPGNVERQTDKIRRTLDALEVEADALEGDLTIGGIAVACALGYLDFRLPQLAWRDDRPRLAAWYADVAKRPSMKATEPHA